MIPSQLFTWRRELRKQMEAQGFALPVAPAPASLFVPAVIEPSPPSEVLPVAKRPRRRRRSSPSAVELEIDGVAVRIARGTDILQAPVGLVQTWDGFVYISSFRRARILQMSPSGEPCNYP
jgi:transposase-like protein